MPRLRQNDRERAVGMVYAGMTHQAVADHVSRTYNFKAIDSSSTNSYVEWEIFVDIALFVMSIWI